MIGIVQRLVEKKLAYLADDKSVYFAIDKFKGYGKLSRLDTREVKAGARVMQDDYSKENAQDFALWKAAKPEDEATGAAWDSPWGRGRPGWHLECSAMAMKYLGETLDIHCGGIDLIFPHHEDEIAQSEGATGKPFSRFWCHGEFLLTDGSKMAKRLGNVATVQDLRDHGVPAAAFRHFVFSTHYRKQLNMSGDAIEASMEGVRRIADFAQRLGEAKGATPELEKIAEEAEAEVIAALVGTGSIGGRSRRLGKSLRASIRCWMWYLRQRDRIPSWRAGSRRSWLTGRLRGHGGSSLRRIESAARSRGRASRSRTLRRGPSGRRCGRAECKAT
jgi:cysteinyl-tRNA synthetase